jgi:hypothetical protein
LLVPKIGTSGCLAVVAFGLPGRTYTWPNPVSRYRPTSEAIARLTVVLLALVAAVVWGHESVGAQAADQATVHIDDSTPRPGQVVRVTGTCPRPGVGVLVRSHSPSEDRTGESVVDLGYTTADANGAFAVAVTIPADLDPNTSIDGGPRGAWIIAAGCIGGPWGAELTITLDGSTQPGELANTGDTFAPPALIAVVTIAIGVGLTTARKRLWIATRPIAETRPLSGAASPRPSPWESDPSDAWAPGLPQAHHHPLGSSDATTRAGTARHW